MADRSDFFWPVLKNKEKMQIGRAKWFCRQVAKTEDIVQFPDRSRCEIFRQVAGCTVLKKKLQVEVFELQVSRLKKTRPVGPFWPTGRIDCARHNCLMGFRLIV